MYDPSIGRFQVADPSVPYVFDSQSYNRYSYTRNNPLKYTDPSGYCDIGDNAGTDNEDMGDDGGSDGGGGGNYFDGEAEEQWYRENVYTDIDIAYNKAFSDGVPGVAPSPSDSSNRTSHYDLFSIEYTLGVRNKYQVAALPQVIVGLGVIGYLSTGKMVNVVGSGAIISISLSQKRSSKEYETVYRVWGGDSPLYGRSWTPNDPRLSSNYRNAAGLPTLGPVNSGEYLSVGLLVDRSAIIHEHPAQPLHGNKGGWPEYEIDNPRKNIDVIDTINMSPPF